VSEQEIMANEHKFQLIQGKDESDEAFKKRLIEK
jgi:hypothetical protein